MNDRLLIAAIMAAVLFVEVKTMSEISTFVDRVAPKVDQLATGEGQLQLKLDEIIVLLQAARTGGLSEADKQLLADLEARVDAALSAQAQTKAKADSIE